MTIINDHPNRTFFRIAVAVVLSLLVLIFAFQNTDTVATQFLAFSVSIPLIALLSLATAIGALVGAVVARHWIRERPGPLPSSVNSSQATPTET